MDFTEFAGYLLLFVLLICSALISGAEVALFSITKPDIEEHFASNTRAQNIIIQLLERPKKLLATILVANNFVNIGIVILFAYLSNSLFNNIASAVVRFVLEVVLVTFLILFFGEILPKIYATRNRVKFALFMAYPLRVLDIIFSPISLPMRNLTLFIHNRLGKQKSNLSVDQLSQALELTNEDDTSVEEQKNTTRHCVVW